MTDSTGSTTIILQRLIDRLRKGDRSAASELIDRSYERFRAMLGRLRYGRATKTGEKESQDALQNAAMKIWRNLAIADDVTFETVYDYFAFSALQIRRALIDEIRRENRHQARQARDAGSKSDSTYDPARLALWTELHEAIENLPPELRTIVDLLFYSGLSTSDAADVLDVSQRTVQLRWTSARLRLQDLLGDLS